MIYVLALSTPFRSSTYFLSAIHTFSVAGKKEENFATKLLFGFRRRGFVPYVR